MFKIISLLCFFLLTQVSAKELSRKEFLRLLPSTIHKESIEDFKLFSIEPIHSFKWSKFFKLYELGNLSGINEVSYHTVAYDGKDQIIFLSYYDGNSAGSNFLKLLKLENQKMSKERFKDFIRVFTVQGNLISPLTSLDDLSRFDIKKSDYKNFPIEFSEDEQGMKFSFYYFGIFTTIDTSLHFIEIHYSKSKNSFTVKDKHIRSVTLL